MPIEIREIIIKTEIVSIDKKPAGASARELNALRKQLLSECRKIIAESIDKRTYKR